VNQQEFAAHIGQTPGYITQLKNNGRLIMNGDQVDVEATQRLIEETADPSKVGVVERHKNERNASTPLSASSTDNASETGTERSRSADMDDMRDNERSRSAGSAFQQARAMTEKYKAMAAKIAYEKEVGQLLVASEVNAAVADGDLIVCERIEAMIHSLASELEGIQGEQQRLAIMLDHWENIRSEISRSFYRMVKT
jgi:hypothetical protein